METANDGHTFEVRFSKDAMHCRGCGTLVNKTDTRGGLCIDCLYKKAKMIQPTLFERM